MRIHRLALPTAAAVLLALAATANVMSGAEDRHPDWAQQQEPVSKAHTMLRQRLLFPQEEHRATQEQDPNEVMIYAAVLDDDDELRLPAGYPGGDELADGDTAVVRAAGTAAPDEQPTKKDLISPKLKSTTVQVLSHSTKLAHGQLDGVLPSYVDIQAFKSIEEHEQALLAKRQELKDKRMEMLAEKGKLVVAKDELEGLEAELAEVETLLGIAGDALRPKKRRWFKAGNNKLRRRRWRRYKKKIAARKRNGSN